MNPAIRVLLVDDHSLFRSGVKSLLQRFPQFKVIGEAGDGMEGVKRAGQLKPDVILLDLHMPGLSGVECARMIKREHPRIHILILTVSEEADDLLVALRAGACGYLLKNIEAETLVTAIESAANDEPVVSPAMMHKLIGSVRADLSPLGSSEPALQQSRTESGEALTRREREIVTFLARGSSNKLIARELDLAESTVKIHVQNILRKLGLTSRVQVAVYAVEHGLVSPHET